MFPQRAEVKFILPSRGFVDIPKLSTDFFFQTKINSTEENKYKSLNENKIILFKFWTLKILQIILIDRLIHFIQIYSSITSINLYTIANMQFLIKFCILHPVYKAWSCELENYYHKK